MSNQDISKQTRFYRKIHKWLAVPMFLVMFLIGVTGLLLGWKKQTALLPKTQKGTTEVSTEWLKIDSLVTVAKAYSRNMLKKADEIDRIDIRPQKGIAKIVFAQHFTELQLDCKTAEILSISTRKSDFIEKIHDGSIVDYFIKTSSDQFKLFYTSAASLSLILLSFSGFWLWYNPIRIKRRKQIS
ncbi:PepSY domain-containing protein [Lacihabitans sp. CCS-44]|uniref:PepSY domain-containing protein n=1 Tax=Lacihabitans sp. CCS-44 TaxID=2487331 RepID=UPI0020CC41A0|nr:PepSY domain-containing protein [Lacihabitans sp. CCS-44]MCP9756054.1 PepSY domain-containing protein [Lacihabitans sp. CCS-44]